MFPDRKTRSFLDPEVLSRLAGVPLYARRAMQGALSGRHMSPHRGSSVEFAEYRRYVPGDDIRRLDWRAYGRSDRYYVKEYEADTNLRCCLIVDTSGSMGFGSAGVTKIEYARRIAGSLGYLALQQGDAVGLSCVADGLVENIPPRRNPAHLVRIFDLLEKMTPRAGTDLVSVLHELSETIGQRALIILVSDLFVPPAELRSCFQHLRFRKHDLAVFHLLDPLELTFEFARPMRFQDMEGGSWIFSEPYSISERYHKAVENYLEELRGVILESAVDYHRVTIDENYEQVLTRFIIGRTRTRGVR